MDDYIFLNYSDENCVDMVEYLWHVRHDPSTQPSVMITFAVLYSMIIVIGVLGNTCVILSIARTKSLQTVPNMFIFALSCSDIFVCFTSATITPITAFHKQWIFGRFLCSTAPFISGVSLCFSTFILAAISLDRFFLIKYPYKRQLSHKQAFIVINLIFIFSMAINLPVTFMQELGEFGSFCGEFCYENWQKYQGLRRAYGTLLLIVQFIVPLAIITFCYTTISEQLRKKSLSLRAMRNGVQWRMSIEKQCRTGSSRRQRTNRMFIAMVFAFSISWFWSVVFNLLRDFDCLPDVVQEKEYFFGILTHWIAMTSTIWNPIFYALLNVQLRTAFVELLPFCIKNCFQNTSSIETSKFATFAISQKMHPTRKITPLNEEINLLDHRNLEMVVMKKKTNNSYISVSF